MGIYNNLSTVYKPIAQTPLPKSQAKPTASSVYNIPNPYSTVTPKATPAPATPIVAGTMQTATPAPMQFTPEQTSGLTAAAARRTAGSASATDLQNLAYAEARGFKATNPATPVTASGMITGYKADGTPVQVPRGQYVPGISLTKPTTSTGEKINPETGGVTPPTPTYQNEQNAVSEAEKAYRASLSLTPEETAAQAELDALQSSFKQAYQNEADTTVPLEFITGKQTSLENRALNLAEPLNQKLARMQAQRLASQGATKFALERADKTLESAKNPTLISAGSGETLLERDPITGKLKTAFSSPTTGKVETSITEVNGKKLLINTQTGETIKELGGAGSDVDYNKMLTIDEAKALGLPFGSTVGDAVGVTPGQKDTNQAKNVVISYADNTINKVKDALNLLPKTSGLGGLGRKAASLIPNTESYALNSIIRTIQANFAFDRLQQMRDASPTGGALGQVSERELALLESSVQSLDLGLDNATLQKNLEAAQKHYENWKATLTQGSQGSGVGADGSFSW